MKLDLYILIVTLVTIAVGLLLGLLRGSRRSVLRLLLVLLCVVGAYFLKDVVTSAMLKMDIQGQNIEQVIISGLPEEMQNMGDVIMPIVAVIISVVSFLLCFGLLQFITWAIVFPLLKLVVKKGKKKHALVGGLVGAVQGVAVAFVLCVVLNGLFVNVGSLMAAMENEQQPENSASSVFAATESDGGSVENGSSGQNTEQIKQLIAQFNEYKQSAISKFYCKIGDKAFDFVTSVKIQTEDGEISKVTLKGQIDAVAGMLKLAQNADKLQNINFGTNGIVGCADSIKEVFDLLDDINKDLSKESQETLNKVVKNVAESMLPADIPIDVTVIDFTKVDFAAEGQIITDLASYADKKDTITETDAENIVKKVIESDLIIPLLTSTGDIDLGLDAPQKEEALKIIEKYESENAYDADKIAKVKDFFGLNDTGSSTIPPEQQPVLPEETVTQ